MGPFILPADYTTRMTNDKDVQGEPVRMNSDLTSVTIGSNGNTDYTASNNIAGESENKYPFGSMDWLYYEATHGNEAAIDMYYSYALSENSMNNARKWTSEREDSQYQRLVKDLKSAGINPYFALSGGSPVSSSTQGVNYQGGQYTSRGSTIRNVNSRELINAVNAGVSIGDSVLDFIASIIGSVMRSKSSKNSKW